MRKAPFRTDGHPAGLFGPSSPFLAVALAGALVACGKSISSSSSPNGPQAPKVTLQALTVDPPTATVGKGLGVQFTATGHYSDDSTAILPLVTWSTSDGTVADIDAGLVSCKKQGPVTITATDPDSGKSATAQLTVEDATLQSVEIVPSRATVVTGFTRNFQLIGRYSDGTSTTLSNVSWSASDGGSLVDLSAVGVVSGKAAGALTVTGKDVKSGLSAVAAVTVVLPPTPVDVAASSSTSLDASGVFYGHVGGLAAGTEYLVRISSADPAVAVEAEKDRSFATPVCSTWAAGPACHAGALAGADLYYVVSGPSGAAYTVDVFPIPSLLPTVAATVTTEDYYKIAMSPGARFTVTLAGLSDDAADVFVYDAAQPAGNFDSNLLCFSTATSLPAATKTCSGNVPASGNLYITVEGWLTGFPALTGIPEVAPGSTYTLSVL